MRPAQNNKNNRNHKAQGGNRQKKQSVNSKIFLVVVLIAMLIFMVIVCTTLSPHDRASTNESTDISDVTGTPISEAITSSADTQTQSQTQEPTAQSESTTLSASKSTTASSGSSDKSVQVIKMDNDNWELTLVNGVYRLPDGFVPEKLITVVNDCRLDSKVAPHYIDMYNAALANGVKLTPFSGYRSYDVQERNYNNKINYYVNQGYDKSTATAKAATIIMPPGSSEHNLGYAMDIVSCESSFENTDAFTWLQENAYKYGFIMRYAKEKQDITGVIYEPWHWRYVGVKVATELYQTRDANGVEKCLEEYLNK